MDILKPPCLFCNYEGEKYWESLSHDPDCPFYIMTGRYHRQAALINAVKKLWILYKNRKESANVEMI